MKSLLIKKSRLCYGFSAVLWIIAVLLLIQGRYEGFAIGIGIAGIILALDVADSTGKLTPINKRKD